MDSVIVGASIAAHLAALPAVRRHTSRLLPKRLQRDLMARATAADAGGAEDAPPSLPTGYKVPDVWTFKDLGGKMGAMNRPTAGARMDLKLNVGKHPYQLYSLGTPNGVKVTAMLEELGVEYDAWFVDIFKLEQFGSEFVGVNPNSKIPALMDHSVSGAPQRVFESGHILLYLAEKEEKFIPKPGTPQRVECMNWLFWQMASAPYIGGGFGHFYNYAPVKIEYCIDRFSMETKRQLDVLDKRLAESPYLAGPEYTIADIATWPWIQCLFKWYGKAAAFLQLEEEYPRTRSTAIGPHP
mmetsp:Transcript_62068/g.196251  ORF Transcript_62068/g.196251 Transcript_62068/m.196251 type:complete len:297 (+) Transcript_62068:126-1016(+)